MDELDRLEDIPVVEFPGLESLINLGARVNALEAEVERLRKMIADAKKVEGTVISGWLPGGMMHDRVAEARAAIKALTEDPGQPHHGAAQAALRLNWGQMSVED